MREAVLLSGGLPLAEPLAQLLMLALLAWLPGAVLHRVFHVARGPWGTGVLAVEVTLSLAFLSFVLAPAYLLGASVASAAIAALLATALVVVAAWRYVRASDESFEWEDLTAPELVCFVLAVAALVPTTLRYSGANVDDWWDLSFVSGWIAEGHFGFRQMALSPDPGTHASAVHPRFLWSVWLTLQSIVAWATGAAAWKIQAGPLAGMTSVLAISAQAALARAMFRHRSRTIELATATVVMAAVWIWGTDSLPLFVRGYQDKLFAAFVLAPVLIAVVLDSASLRLDEDFGTGRAAAIAVSLAAVATVSVHSLVYTMALVVALLAVVARLGTNTPWWLRERRAVVAGLALVALYPVVQALVLDSTFGEQGISLATRDNPVVRAHLSLNRLLGDVGPMWIVHPAASFGAIALVAAAALLVAWRRRHWDDSARMLLAMSLVPAALLFVPGVAAVAGKIWVPWMLYRLGWLVPVAPVLAYAAVFLAVDSPAPRRSIPAALLVGVAIVVAVVSAGDRLRRDMHEHPDPAPGAPTGAARQVYDFLALQPGRAAVLAPPNFSELVPAIAGKPVVAFSERGTLVFSTGEPRAYERLRDRAAFFAATTTPVERDRLAVRYDVRWAVLPRTLVSRTNEAAWLWRYGAEALLASRKADEDTIVDCAGGQPVAGREGCSRTWWSATPGGARQGLSAAWTIVLETRDYFVAERVLEPDPAPPEAEAARAPSPAWLRPFALTGSDTIEGRTDILASAVDKPGAVVSYDVPPRFVLPSVMPVWLEGPSPWEDVPADVAVTLDARVPCVFSAVSVVPHLPHQRRDVLEVGVDGRAVRAAAHDGKPIVVAADPVRRSSVTVRVRSLIGSPVSLANIRLLGDWTSCDDGWPREMSARTPGIRAAADELLALAASLPSSGKPFVSLSHIAGRARGGDADIPLLEEAVRRQPELVEAWLDLGFAHDRIAASALHRKDAAGAEAASREARRAFRSAVRADSESAWARGCLAWFDQRHGHALSSVWQALAAMNVDPLYGDSWTIIAYALGDLGLYSLAERSLVTAERRDADRNWPALARADIAMARHRDDAGDAAAAVEAARNSLRSWIREHPFDQAARDKLSEISELAASAAQQAKDAEREGNAAAEERQVE